MDRFKIVISIINFRTPEMTIACVDSVLADQGDLNAHVVVVDNASGDQSIPLLQRWLEEKGQDAPITLVQSPDNSGFSGGHNQGIGQYEADHYLILNSDALLRPGFFEALFKAVEANPKAGLFSPIIEDEEGNAQVSYFRAHTPVSEFLRGAGIGALTRALRRYEVPIFDASDAADIDWVSFACVLVRGAVFEQTGPMDADYFLYYEDSAFCHEARAQGWEFCLVPDACALHYEGGSGPVQENVEQRKRQPAYLYAARTRYFYQTGGYPKLIAANLMWNLGRIVSIVRWIAMKPHRAVPGEFSGIWTQFFTPLKAIKAPK